MMTREEYKTGNGIIPSYQDTLVDRIFDDFESRVCYNCKFSEKSTINSELIFCMHYDLYMFDDSIPKDFGCNKFERKTDGDV